MPRRHKSWGRQWLAAVPHPADGSCSTGAPTLAGTGSALSIDHTSAVDFLPEVVALEPQFPGRRHRIQAQVSGLRQAHPKLEMASPRSLPLLGLRQSVDAHQEAQEEEPPPRRGLRHQDPAARTQAPSSVHVRQLRVGWPCRSRRGTPA